MEHPAYADIWKLLEIVEFKELPGVMSTVADQCMYGLMSSSNTDLGEAPAMKPMQFMSNGWCLLQELSVRCDKSHRHQQLMGGRAAKAAEYPHDSCKPICRGIVDQQRYDRSRRVCTGGLNADSLSSLLQSVKEGAENHVKPPAGHVNAPWSNPSNIIKHSLSIGLIPHTNPRARVGFTSSQAMLKGEKE